MAPWKPLALSLSAAAIFASLASVLFLSGSPRSLYPDLPGNTNAGAFGGQRPKFKAPALNVWAELSDIEAADLYAYLDVHHQPSAPSKEPLSSNAIYLIEVLRPNKSDAVDYLDNGGPTPERWARATFLESNDDEAFIVDYMVGPLPATDKTEIRPLTYLYNSGRNYVQSPVADVFEVMDYALAIGENVSDITQDLLGAVTNRDDPEDPDALVVGLRPALKEGGHLVLWLEFYGPSIRAGASTLLPQGLYFKLDVPCPNPDSWTTKDWFYNGIMYDNDTMLRKAMSEPGFERLATNDDGSWTETEYFGQSIPEHAMPPPLSIQPYGPRYHLDRSQSYISWMGFSFYIATNQATALSLFDIRYNHTRIIYHLGLQEALAHYAGSEPLQSGLEFLDTFFGMGSMMFSLVPGIDCPGYAEYLDLPYHKDGQKYTNKNAICVFEYTSDAPLQRHTMATSATVSRNTYLVVRSVSTVGNYDYTIDYIFYLDGSMEVKLRASGYIITAFAPEPRDSASSQPTNDAAYGYRIHPAVHTSLHDHVVSFRADFDIHGTANTVLRTTICPVEQHFAWDAPEISGPRHAMHMKHEPIRHETPLSWPANSAGAFTVVNPHAHNAWGEPRGYRIMPGTGTGTPSHLVIENSTALARSAAWSSADLWVLRHHDTEPAGAHHLNFLDARDPLVDFARMLDGESVQEEDLVLYFNLGGHHVPSAQDVPNTLMHTSASSVMFMPMNYFDDDVSRYVRQGVRVDRTPAPETNDAKDGVRGRGRKMRNVRQGDGDDDGVRYFGGRYEGPVTIDKERLSPDLSGYMRGADGDLQPNRVGGGVIGAVGKRGPGKRAREEGEPPL